MPELNVAILGYKFMGRAHSNAYRQVRRFFPGKYQFRMKVLCGPENAPVEAAARQLGWEESATDWRKVVVRKDIDVIDVSTPNYLHYLNVMAAARAGKHIICEKPPGNDLKQAREMLKAVEKAGVKHMLMHNYRKVPAVALAKKMISEGRLGRIYHYHGAYLQDWIMDPKLPLVWRLQKDLAGSGALGDIGSHAIDLAQHLNGDIESVTAHLTTFIKERPLLAKTVPGLAPKPGRRRANVTVDDDANFLARFRNHSVGVIESSRFCGGRRNYNTFQIYGSKGSIAFNLERMNELEYYDATVPIGEQGYKTIGITEAVHPYMSAWWPPGHIIGYEHTFVHALHDFLVAMEEDRQPEPNFYDGVKIQAVLAAAERSAQSEKWEKVQVLMAH